jgi:RNA polymerase sigma factor (sigma-70 family)
MNTQCATTVSVSGTTINHSASHYRRREQSRAAAGSRSRQHIAEGRINAAAFDQFLCWLGPDPETAGRKYESIRGRLIMMFQARRCVFAEDLADATFERVARKLADPTTVFTGDPARYFYGVAKKIYLEYQRHQTAAHFRTTLPVYPGTEEQDQDLEIKLNQLEEALTRISESDRELILKYYTGTGKSKIDYRRALARQIGIEPNALRLRVFRIRMEIRNRMLQSNVGRPALLT